MDIVFTVRSRTCQQRFLGTKHLEARVGKCHNTREIVRERDGHICRRWRDLSAREFIKR